MELSLRELVFAILRTGIGVIGEKTISVFRKLVLDKRVQKITKSGDLSKLQKDLFGFGENFAVLRGRAKWVSERNPDKIFGDEIPIYDWIGLANVAARVQGFDYFGTQDDDYVIREKSNLLFMGGECVNPHIAPLLHKFDSELPLKFIEIEKVPEKFRPSLPQQVVRVYTDPETGDVYRKERESLEPPMCLVDSTNSNRPPFGPLYCEDGTIETDVFLVTVIPGLTLKKTTLITPGHGSGCKLSEVICNGDFLEAIRKEIEGRQPHTFFQALFLVPVDMNQEREIYKDPDYGK